MCGRFTLRSSLALVLREFSLRDAPQLSLRYNIAPTQQVAVVRESDHARKLSLMQWGLVPSWSKDPKIGSRMINARAETVAEKPSFRSAFKRRRCLVVADGFYEWKKIGKGKQPFYFRMQDQRPFGFAGLWEVWRGEGETLLESCTIITTEANALCREVHDRMPVIIGRADYATWLDTGNQDPAGLEHLLGPYNAAEMIADPVSTYVNRVNNDDPRCVEVQQELF